MVMIACFLHFMVGKPGWAHMLALIGMTAAGSLGSTNIFLVFGDNPVLGGSLFMAAVFSLISLTCFELKARVVRMIMWATIAVLAAMAVTGIPWFVYAVAPGGAEYTQHADQLTTLFVAAVIVYSTMIVRLAAIQANVLMRWQGRYAFVIVSMIGATYVQVQTYHAEFFDVEPSIFFNTVAYRMLLLTVFGFTYFWRFNGKPPTARDKLPKSPDA